MQNLLTKRLFWIAVGFLVVLAALTTLALRQFKPDKTTDEIAPPAANGTVKVESDNHVDEVKENLVIYTDGGFSPNEIGIAVNRGLGCAVNIFNQTSHQLKLGLSPHRKPQDPGPDYPLIAPGAHFLFDPRFTGYTELRFHDHEHPQLDFLVKFEKSCR